MPPISPYTLCKHQKTYLPIPPVNPWFPKVVRVYRKRSVVWGYIKETLNWNGLNKLSMESTIQKRFQTSVKHLRLSFFREKVSGWKLTVFSKKLLLRCLTRFWICPNNKDNKHCVEIKTLNDFIRTGFVNVGVLQKANAHLQFMFM